MEPVGPMLDYLKYLDTHAARPLREYNECQEAIKQCYSATANVYSPSASNSSSASSGSKGGGGGGSKKD